MDILKLIVVVFICFSSGLVVSSAVFAFIGAVGVVPSIASRTNTSQYIKVYEEAIIFGGIFGTSHTFINYNFNFGSNILSIIFVIIYFIAIGIFIGVLASSLAEVIDVIPTFSKRAGIKKGIGIMMLSMAVGKGLGSIIYFLNTNLQNT